MTLDPFFVWWVHGGSGWVNLLRKAHDEGVVLPEEQITAIEHIADQVRILAEAQRARKAERVGNVDGPVGKASS